MHIHKGIAIVLLCTFSFMSCATTVRFRTNAEDAELRINDRYYGTQGHDLALLMETYLSSYDRFELKDRLYLADLLQEKELQATDLFDPSFTAKFGSLSGPKAVLIGQVKKIGDGLSVFVKIVDVESGSQSRVFERSDIFVSSRGVDALKDALKSIAADINVYYLARS